MALNSGIQTYQILTNDDEVCIPSLSSILLAVIPAIKRHYNNATKLSQKAINRIGKSTKKEKWKKLMSGQHFDKYWMNVFKARQ